MTSFNSTFKNLLLCIPTCTSIPASRPPLFSEVSFPLCFEILHSHPTHLVSYFYWSLSARKLTVSIPSPHDQRIIPHTSKYRRLFPYTLAALTSHHCIVPETLLFRLFHPFSMRVFFILHPRIRFSFEVPSILAITPLVGHLVSSMYDLHYNSRAAS